MKKIIIAAAFALALTTPAMAEDFTRVVPLADLNLESPEGQAALETRVEYAVRAVCGEPWIRDLKGMVAWEECKVKARADALEQISFADSFAGVELASRF